MWTLEFLSEVKSLSHVRLEPTTLLRPWDFPGKSPGVWVAISFSRGSSWSRDWTQVSRTVGRCSVFKIQYLFLLGGRLSFRSKSSSGLSVYIPGHLSFSTTAIRFYLQLIDEYLSFLKIILFIYFYVWLCWVFVAARAFLWLQWAGVTLELLWAGFSLGWLLLWSTGSRVCGLQQLWPVRSRAQAL